MLIACIEAGIEELPAETAMFFNSKHPEKYLLEDVLTVDIPVKKWCDENSDGFEIIVSDIPKLAHKIRFSNRIWVRDGVDNNIKTARDYLVDNYGTRRVSNDGKLVSSIHPRYDGEKLYEMMVEYADYIMMNRDKIQTDGND